MVNKKFCLPNLAIFGKQFDLFTENGRQFNLFTENRVFW